MSMEHSNHGPVRGLVEQAIETGFVQGYRYGTYHVQQDATLNPEYRSLAAEADAHDARVAALVAAASEVWTIVNDADLAISFDDVGDRFVASDAIDALRAALDDTKEGSE